MKKLVVLLIVLVLFSALTLSMKRIGITAILEHPALEAVRNGIIDKLEEKGMKKGEDFTELYQTAQGDMNIAISIAKQFADSDLDLAVGISTPSAQALANAINDIPVVFSAVTDPVSASLVEKLGKNKGNVAGISDMTPVRSQIRLMDMLMPEADKVGIIYNSGEANSVSIKEAAKRTCDELDLELIEVIGSNTSEMINALNSVVDDLDFIYIGTDNTAASSIEAISNITRTAGVPIVAGDIDISRGGGVIGFGFDYYKAGLETGEIVYKVLNGTPVSEIESRLINASSLILYVDKDLAQELGIELPKNVLEKADIVVENGVEKEQE